MALSELAGRPAPSSLLVDPAKLVEAYYSGIPDPGVPAQRVSFGTSGHRGSSLSLSFNEAHILSIAQAICDYRKAEGITGPLFLGMDTHALSRPALATALEVFAANGVEVVLGSSPWVVPTPAISRAIISYNRSRGEALADGVVVTPSHNPPEDGGFKYNPPHGGPADTQTTGFIERRANELLASGNKEVRRIPLERALSASTTKEQDLLTPYVEALESVLDMDAIASSGIRMGVDPLGGATLPLWDLICERYGLKIEVVNRNQDPSFGFMTLDHDGRIRMDCSSPYAMAGLIRLKDRFDIAFGNDPDGDRHGIVTTEGGLMNPNHYLAVAVWYLFGNRPGWSSQARVGKTLVTSSMLDRVARHLGRELAEVPVGFKWFVDGLLSGSYGFGGEESAGASFLCQDATPWTTDKDGVIMDLLAAEIMAKTGKGPAELYAHIESLLGKAYYERVDRPITPKEKEALAGLSARRLVLEQLAGEPVLAVLDRAPANGEPIGGVKVVAPNCWFAARPSGTEDIYKLYAESFLSRDHLRRVLEEARGALAGALEEVTEAS
ncbi:MAG: phosphoglucomutase (alpha-D-glucose-1,6-bisphosphate-dependent) [Thermodesulfobacteriota bacterium]